MKRYSTRGMEKKVAPSIAAHPDFQTGQRSFVNSDTLNGAIAIRPKPTPPDCSWWITPTREAFIEARSKRQPFMESATVTDAVPRV